MTAGERHAPPGNDASVSYIIFPSDPPGSDLQLNDLRQQRPEIVIVS